MVQSSPGPNAALPQALLMALSQQSGQQPPAPMGGQPAPDAMSGTPFPSLPTSSQLSPPPFDTLTMTAPSNPSMASPLPAEQPYSFPGASSPSSPASLDEKPAALRKWWVLNNPDAQQTTTLSQIVSNPLSSAGINGAVIGATSGLISLAILTAKKGTAAIKEQLKPVAIIAAVAAVVSGAIEFVAARATNRKYGPLMLQPEVGPLATVAEANRYLQQNQPVWSGQSQGSPVQGGSSQLTVNSAAQA